MVGMVMGPYFRIDPKENLVMMYDSNERMGLFRKEIFEKHVYNAVLDR